MSSTTTVVTADQIIAEVRRLAAESPDFVYQKPEFSPVCLYKHGDGPGCLFGQALSNLGIEVDENTRGTINNVLDRFDVDRTDRQRCWMSTAQRRQDHGSSWAEAVRQADDEEAEDAHE